MTTDVFTSAPAVTAADLVGDDKKFKTADDLAKAKSEADAFIKQLQNENQGMRELVDRNANAERQLEALKNELKGLREASANRPKDNTSPALTEGDIETLIERKVTQREETRTADQNVTESNNRAVKHFGTAEAAQAAIRAKATEMGVSVDFLKDVAAKSPTAFATVIGIGAALAGKEAPKSVGSFVQSDAGAPKDAPVNLRPGTYEYAESVRKSDPVKYWTPAFQQRNIWDARQAGTYVNPED